FQAPAPPAAERVGGGDAVPEPPLLSVHGGFVHIVPGVRGEDRVHEVLRCGVLLQPAHQIGDGDVEILRCHHGGVQDQRAVGVHIGGDGACLGGSHALQHLHVHGVVGAALGGQQVGEGQVEEVVRGDAGAQHGGDVGR